MVPSTSQISSPITLQEMFKKLDTTKFVKVLKEVDAKKLGKKGMQKFNENAPLLTEMTKNICQVAGQAPLVGICFQALVIILQTAEDYMKIDEKANEIKEYVDFLKKSMETIEKAGGGDEYLKENCLALLCAEAFQCQNQNPREQSWGKCMCGFLCAQCDTKTLDGLATRLKDMTLKLSLHCQTVTLNQIPKPSQAPFAHSSLKLNNKEELLKFVTEPGVRVLALCGMGGLGKTTLLTALHQDFPKSGNQAKVFIEVGNPKDPAKLMEIQTQILQGLESKNETFTTTQQGRIRLEDCLKGLKDKGSNLCLSIDNVWKVRHLKQLLPESLHVHLPKSSCLMISTRSQEVAQEFRDICCPKNANAFRLFEPKLMGTQEAELLFMKCAEIENKKEEWNLINEIVPLCGGLPLAIKTYGTYFRRQERCKETEWRKVKQRILTSTESPSTADDDDQVPQCLEPSIDAQIEKVQDAFIDAALFWRGQSLEMARSALYVRDEDILDVLLQESIIYSKRETQYDLLRDEKLILQCHDLFFAIAEKRAKTKGWKYLTSEMQVSKERTEGVRALHIRRESTIDLGFLPLQKNLLYLRCDGNFTTYGACNTSQDKNYDLKSFELSHSIDLNLLQCFPGLQVLSVGTLKYGIECTQVHHQALCFSFKCFSNLRFIEIRRNEQLHMLPNSLDDLEDLQNLRLLGLSCLNPLPAFSKPLISLKNIDLLNCTWLVNLPETLGPLPALERLDLHRCAQLARLPDTLGPLPALKRLDLHMCTQLARLPDTLGPLPALKRLDLSGCAQLARLPDTLGPLPALERLDLHWCAQLSSLPDTLGPLPALERLDLHRCAQLARLPDTLGPLPALERLELRMCTQLASLPDTLGPLPALERLDLSDCAQLASLPDTLGPLPALERLDLTDCPQLARLPDTLGPTPALEYLNLSDCPQLARLPDTLGPLPALQYLYLHGCAQLARLPDTLGPLPALAGLDLAGCAQLARLPDTLGPLPALAGLSFRGCAQLARLPDTLGPLPALRRLDLHGCAQLARLPDTLGPLPALQHLDLSGCAQLASLPDTLGPLPALAHLNLHRCAQLARLHDTLGPLPALLHGCAQLDSLPVTLGPLPALQRLVLSGCTQLDSLPVTLNPLASLVLSGCAQLASLPDSLSPLPALQRLVLSGCAQLACLPDTLGPLPALQALVLSRCPQLARLPDTLGPLPALKALVLHGCRQLACLPDTLGPLPALRDLVLSECNQLSRLPDTLGPLPALQTLVLHGCPQLARLPDTLGPLPALDGLLLHGCPQLARLPDTLGPLPALKELVLSGCDQLACLPDTLSPLPALVDLKYVECAQISDLLNTCVARLHSEPSA